MPSLKEQALIILKEKLHQLENNGLHFSHIDETQFSFNVEIKNELEKFKLLSYFGKKGVKLVIQGNQNSSAYQIISDVVFGEIFFNDVIESEPEEYIGIDESGKGDFFGPLVICGVAINKALRESLNNLNIVDSKLLSNGEIVSTALKLEYALKNSFEVVQINPLKYNELYAKFKNLNKLLAWGHAKVLENLLQRHKVGVSISDKFGNPNSILNALQKLGREIEVRQETKAEKYLAVAAASIIARAKFLKWFEKINNIEKLQLRQGSSLEVQKYFIELEKLRSEQISSFAKMHFKISDKLK